MARGLQARRPEPFLRVGLDLMTETMPRRFLFDGPDADLGARWVTDENGRLLRIDACAERLVAYLKSGVTPGVFAWLASAAG